MECTRGKWLRESPSRTVFTIEPYRKPINLTPNKSVSSIQYFRFSVYSYNAVGLAIDYNVSSFVAVFLQFPLDKLNSQILSSRNSIRKRQTLPSCPNCPISGDWTVIFCVQHAMLSGMHAQSQPSLQASSPIKSRIHRIL